MSEPVCDKSSSSEDKLCMHSEQRAHKRHRTLAEFPSRQTIFESGLSLHTTVCVRSALFGQAGGLVKTTYRIRVAATKIAPGACTKQEVRKPDETRKRERERDIHNTTRTRSGSYTIINVINAERVRAPDMH